MNSKVRILCYCAICIGIAFLLGHIPILRMPQGGSVKACSMLFIALSGYWYGLRWGAASGAAYGLLNLIIDPYVIHPIQLLLDYPLAYMALGALPAMIRQRGVVAAYLLGVAGMFAFAFTSGLIFISEFLPEANMTFFETVVYSASYNASYIVPEVLFTLILIAVPTLRRAIERLKI